MTSFPAQVLIPAGFPQLQLLRFELETDQQSSVTLRSMRDVWTYLHNETKKVSQIISGCFLTARASWALQVRLEFRCVKAKLKIWADFSFLANLISLSFFFVAFCYQTARAKCKWLTEESISEKLRGYDLQALSPVPRRSLVELTFRRQPDARLEFHFTLLTLNAFLKWPQRCSFNRNPAFSSAGCSRCRHQCSLVV